MPEQSLGALAAGITNRIAEQTGRVRQFPEGREDMSQANAVVQREEQVPTELPESAAILNVIERAARDPNVDIDKFERLMAMKERVEDRAKEDAFNAAMAEAQTEIAKIQVVRDRNNPHTKSRYATLEAVSKVIAPIYTRHGFSLSFGTEKSELPNHHRITCIASHKAGHSRHFGADLPADIAGSQGKTNKTPIQGFGSTMSYGRRYLTLLIFNVAIKGEDDDGNGVSADASPVSDEQRASLQAMIDETHSDIRLFCNFFGIEALTELPASRYEEASARLQQKARKAAKT